MLWRRIGQRLTVGLDRAARYAFAPFLVRLATATLVMGPILLIVGKCIEVRWMPVNPDSEGGFALTAEFRDTKSFWGNVGEGIASRMGGGYFWIMLAVAWAAVGVTRAGQLLERSQPRRPLSSSADPAFASAAMALVCGGAGLYLFVSMQEGAGLFMTTHEKWDALTFQYWPTIGRDLQAIFQVRACNGVMYLALVCAGVYMLVYQARLIWRMRMTIRSRNPRGASRAAKSLIESLTAPFVGSYSFWVVYSFTAKSLGLPDDPEKILQVFGEFAVFSLPYMLLWLAARSVLRPFFVLHINLKAFPHIFTVTSIPMRKSRRSSVKASGL